jgi:polyhydroxybutyrate depolymerase
MTMTSHGFLAAVVLVQALACVRGASQDVPPGQKGEKGMSPGPTGALTGRDYRVPLTWLSEPGSYGPGNYGRRIRHGGLDRYYEIHVPPQHEPGKPSPVVCVLHGGGGFATIMRYMTGMDEVSDREGFLVVYPAGTHTRFDDRLLFWTTGHKTKDPKQGKVDDVGYFAMLLDDLAKYFTIDESRIYATGISNGAQMCYRLAAELPDRFAAIGPVAAQAAVSEFQAKPAAHPTSVLHIHGLKDEWNNYQGGESWGGEGRGERSVFEPFQLAPVEDAVRSWAERCGTGVEPKEEKTGGARCLRYTDGRDGAEVVLWTVSDGGHTWPGGAATKAEERKGVGPVSKQLDASQLLWEFFERHSLPK